jgi:hypothetical protein
MYYFRLVEPDFSPMPVYEALKGAMAQPPTLYPGVHQEDHWALAYEGAWETREDLAAELGASRSALSPESTLSFAFEGSEVWLRVGPEGGGTITYSLDGAPSIEASFGPGEQVLLAQGLSKDRHTIDIRPASGPLTVDSVTVRQAASPVRWLVGAALLAAAAAAVVLTFRALSRRRRWYQRRRAPR